MLGTAIEYLDSDRRSYAACPNLPEFAFSPKAGTRLSRLALCCKCEKPIHERPGQRRHFYIGDVGPMCIDCADAHVLPQHGPMVPPTISAPRPKGTKRVLSKDEENWLHLQPKFSAPVEAEFVAPHGTAKPFVPASFAAREAEYEWLVATQHQDLPSLAQEFRANGLTAISLSSSFSDENDDDSLTAANLAESHLGHVPYAHDTTVYVFDVDRVDPDAEDGDTYLPNLSLATVHLDIVEIAARLRRIEWEKTIVYSGLPVRIYAAKKADGGRTLRCTDRRWSKDDILAYADRIREVVGERSMDDIEQARARAQTAKRLVWSLMTPDQKAAWVHRDPEVRAYLDPEAGVESIEAWTQPLRDFDDLAVILVEDPDEEGALVTQAAPLPEPESGPQELHLHSLSEGSVDYETYDFANAENGHPLRLLLTA